MREFIEPAERGMTIQKRFELFHAANPWVYDELLGLITQMRSRGRRRLGIGMLFEVLRWNWYLQTDDPTSEWKLNNNYRSRYARLIIEDFPHLEGFFELRALKAA